MENKTSASEIPAVLIVLGATGDLFQRKIIPAICHLQANQRLPNHFRVVGVARGEIKDADFQANVRSQLEAQMPDVGSEIRDKVSSQFFYHQGEFGDKEMFQRLKNRLDQIDNECGMCSNKLFYLAVPPSHFQTIFKGMARAGLNIPCGGKLGWTRLLIEKPFGENLASAKKLFNLLGKHFKEEQLYFIDHYLAKNIVQAIQDFRFSNNLFEKSWNNHSIERIDIHLLETIGVEDRGAFYDAVGAFRDVGQNHLLQMLAGITTDPPRESSAAATRSSRADVMEALRKWTAPSIQKQTFRAQYDGYRSVAEVAPQSNTETYFKLQTELTHPAWRGVPITMASGKRCSEVKKEVVVTFKPPRRCAKCEPGQRSDNRVVFKMEPEDRISIHFFTSPPGFERKLEERTFDFFLHEHAHKKQYVEEYAVLIFDCLMGDQALFVSEREVLAQWRFTDPVLSAWQKNKVPLNRYSPGSDQMIRDSAQLANRHCIKEMAKEVAIVGLGKMGANMARRMMDQGWRVVGVNKSSEATKKLAKEGLIPSYSLKEAAHQLSKQKVFWLMVPAGHPVDEVLFGKEGLVKYLQKGDFVIDGGNSFYEDTIERAKRLQKYGIRFLDCGTSGGPGGARHGACLMIGGRREDFETIEPLFISFAAPDAYQFFEGSGAGHFVKMIHNGIEYGMMQAIAEGFTLLKKARYKLDLSRISDVYNRGSVIQSRLMGWLKEAFDLYGADLKPITGTVQQSGEGLWTDKTARRMNVAAKVIREAVLFRFHSLKKPSFTGKVVSAMRGQFGGHAVLRKIQKS